MLVFVTGGSGLVGNSLIPQLVEAGHTVTALARTDASVSKVSALGATPVRGAHTDLDVLRKAAGEADATIHLAFNHGIMMNPGGAIQACQEDRDATSAICDAIIASGKPGTFISSSGTLGSTGEDETSGKHGSPHNPRHLSEELTRAYGEKGVRTIVMRLPPVVHGPGYEHPFISTQIKVAKETGVAAYIGDGSQLWPSVHVKDAAALYVLALTKGPSGVNMHAVQEEGIPVKEIAEFIAKKLGAETKSIATSQEAIAGPYGGFVGWVMGLGGKATTVKTKEWTGWEPKEYGLFKELEGYKY